MTEALAKMLKPCHCGKRFTRYHILEDELICADGHKTPTSEYMRGSVTVREYKNGARPSKEHLWPTP
jgi:hypothetical protein